MKFGISIILIWLFNLTNIFCQKPDVMDIMSNQLLDITSYFIKSESNNPIAESNYNTYEALLINSHYDTLNVYLRFDKYTRIDSSLNKYEKNIISVDGKYLFYALEIPPDSNGIKVSFHIPKHKDREFKVLMVNSKYYPFVQLHTDGNVYYYSFLIGRGVLYILLFLNFMNFGGYFVTRRKDFLYYGFYTLLVMIFTLLQFWFYPYLFVNGVDIFTELQYFSKGIQPLFYVFFCKFAQHYLETKNRIPQIHSFLNYFIIISLISSGLIIFTHPLFPELSTGVYQLFRITAIILGIYIIFLTAKSKEKLAKYIVMGTSSLILIASLAMYQEWRNIVLFGLIPITVFTIAFVVEFLFFTLGLAQKTAIETYEKLKAQTILNETLIEKEKLQHSMQEDLKIQLEIAKDKIIEEQKQNTQAQIDLKTKESELEVMLSQMNPHFMFNSMNSLKSLIVKGEKGDALQHIDQFSKLLRNFLDFTKEKTIPIQEIVDNIRLYVVLESKRLYNDIKLEVIINPDIEPEFDEIPAFLIQPFVENSILHGLAYNQIKNPHIIIEFYHKEKWLCIDITDNGVGRKAASEKSDLDIHIGIATNLTRKRIKLLNEGVDGLSIEDLYNTDGTPAGTKVMIRLLR